jgi:hypothetical protein
LLKKKSFELLLLAENVRSVVEAPRCVLACDWRVVLLRQFLAANAIQERSRSRGSCTRTDVFFHFFAHFFVVFVP